MKTWQHNNTISSHNFTFSSMSDLVSEDGGDWQGGPGDTGGAVDMVSQGGYVSSLLEEILQRTTASEGDAAIINTSSTR